GRFLLLWIELCVKDRRSIGGIPRSHLYQFHLVRGVLRHQGIETELHDNLEEARTINREFRRRS
ncbi:hypothetical protein LINGRAHAP2_LOCUS14625, partial [Linum grandiflorum]